MRPPVSRRPNLLSGEGLPPPPRQRRSRENLERIKAAGLSLFAERGYEGTSVEAVARKARVAVGGFYLYYRSKRQLLLALTDELLEALERVELDLGEVPDVRRGLRALLARALDADLRYLGVYRAWQEAVLSSPDLAARHRLIHAWTTRRVATALKALQRVPGARGDLDLTGLARVMDHLFWSFLARARDMNPGEVSRWIDATTRMVYHTMFRDSLPKGPAA